MAVNDQIEHTDDDSADVTRSCARKRGYPSEEIARLGVAAIRRVNPGAQVRPYGCRHCGQWHVGGTPAAEQTHGPVEPLLDSFDAERDRRRRDRSGKPARRRAYGDGYSRRSPRRHERVEHD